MDDNGRPSPGAAKIVVVMSAVAVLLALTVACGAEDLAASRPQELEVASDSALSVLREYRLPAELRFAMDVRWLDDDSVLVAAGRSGVYELSFRGSELRAHPLSRAQDPPSAAHLAITPRHLITAHHLGLVSWSPRADPTALATESPLSVAIDFDVLGDLAVFLGARFDGLETEQGAVVWAGSLDRGFEDLEPRLFAEDGPRGRDMANCWFLFTGAVRALGNDRYFVAPGVQPGAFLYHRNGRLLHAWQSADLDFIDRCDLDDEASYRLGAAPKARHAWLHPKPVLDEVLPWDGWPALVVKRPSGEGSEWSVQVLNEDGPSQRFPIPIRGASKMSRLKGDVLGDRIVFLVAVEGRADEPAAEPPRLVVLRRTTAEPVSRGGEPSDTPSEVSP